MILLIFEPPQRTHRRCNGTRSIITTHPKASPHFAKFAYPISDPFMRPSPLADRCRKHSVFVVPSACRSKVALRKSSHLAQSSTLQWLEVRNEGFVDKAR